MAVIRSERNVHKYIVGSWTRGVLSKFLCNCSCVSYGCDHAFLHKIHLTWLWFWTVEIFLIPKIVSSSTPCLSLRNCSWNSACPGIRLFVISLISDDSTNFGRTTWTFSSLNIFLTSALYLRLKKRRFEICVGRFHEKLYSNLRLLLTKTQYSSDITSKVRIYRFTPDITRGNSIKSKGALWRQKNSKKLHNAKKNSL